MRSTVEIKIKPFFQFFNSWLFVFIFTWNQNCTFRQWQNDLTTLLMFRLFFGMSKMYAKFFEYTPDEMLKYGVDQMWDGKSKWRSGKMYYKNVIFCRTKQLCKNYYFQLTFCLVCCYSSSLCFTKCYSLITTKLFNKIIINKAETSHSLYYLSNTYTEKSYILENTFQ